MTARVEAVIAEVLGGPKYAHLAADDARRILAALKASRIAVVELPEPVLSPRHQERVWEVGDSYVMFNEKWRTISAELDYDNGDDDPLPPSEARAFGAALFAAADAVEVDQ
ncbi:hypothetical protein [Mycobacterium aquaticum]|uniref:Uncharacterized protein n=1 Tax=Mycobacterium aquaticum TaxID=1927124 RepID=A0A1X0A5P3_9MYCO|nr:hypothetical protein [Mycobacterium aquaticum]ORA25205.1 hypothetical protein BST13_33335 [Mycobacterium aquaticum]